MRRFQTLRPLVLALAMGVVFGLGLLGYAHKNNGGKSPYAGPIPCLTEDWGGKYRYSDLEGRGISYRSRKRAKEKIGY